MSIPQNAPPHTERGRRARARAIELVGIPSVTGTASEALCADAITAMLARIDYFAAHPQHLRKYPVPGAPEGRTNVLGLIKGTGRRTVVLAGHFDVVTVENYFALAALAYQPEALSDAMIETLEASGEAPHVLDDLRSGAFLPGRGLLDMKSGLAAALLALEDFAARPERVGNLVFLAVPDEENQSAGMRAAGPQLRALSEEHDLDLALLINLDALQDEGVGEAGQVVGLGCVGKHLVTALVVGREAHACYPFTGVNAAYLAAALVAEIEAHPALAERVGGQPLAPPAVLVARDLKQAYDVTTPERCWCAWNVLVYERSARDVIETFRTITAEVAEAALQRLARRADETSLAFPFERDAVQVTTYLELHQAACVAGGAAYLAERDVLARQLADDLTTRMPDKARQLTELACDRAGLKGPAIVIGFGSLSYPPVPSLSRCGHASLEQVVRDSVERVSVRHGTSVAFVEALPIICDMSFACVPNPDDQRHATQNNPLWGEILSWDTGGAVEIPSINIGPWGRDYHHRFERANVRYAFDILPDLVLETADAVLTVNVETD